MMNNQCLLMVEARVFFRLLFHTFSVFMCSVCVCSVAQSYLTLCNPMDYSLTGSSVHGIFQARILECAISYSRGSS